jgi:hypothetical protein
MEPILGVLMACQVRFVIMFQKKNKIDVIIAKASKQMFWTSILVSTLKILVLLWSFL